MVQKEEGQWTRMAEQMDTKFREVLSLMSQANLMRFLPWFPSTATKSGAGPTCPVSEALTAIMQLRADTPVDDTTEELKDTTAPASTSSLACQVGTLPPVLSILDILAARTPVGHPFFTLAFCLKHKKWH